MRGPRLDRRGWRAARRECTAGASARGAFMVRFDAIVAVAQQGGAHERAAAIEALGSAGPAAAPALPLLRRIASDGASHVHHRALAVAAAASIDAAAASSWLPTLAADPVWRVRAAVATALANLLPDEDAGVEEGSGRDDQ